jgi:hypothetical protein
MRRFAFFTFNRPNRRDSVALYEDVAVGQELNRFESSTVWPKQPLSSFDITFLCAHQT